MQVEAQLYHFLHEKGYNYFNIPRLTYPEIIEMVNGETLASEETKKQMKK